MLVFAPYFQYFESDRERLKDFSAMSLVVERISKEIFNGICILLTHCSLEDFQKGAIFSLNPSFHAS
jgi:hypothetical protein